MGSKAGYEIAVRAVSDGAAGEVRSFLSSLSDADELRGRGSLVSADSDAMGTGLETLMVTLEPGGVAAAFAAVFIAWIRSRRGDVEVEIERPDGTRLRFSAKNARGLSPEQVSERIGQLRSMVDSQAPSSEELAR